MTKRQKGWEQFDNTANLFPVIAKENMTNTYRISVTLNEEVQPELLQEALDKIVPKMPGINLRMRSGVFWYYFEENGKKAPRVVEENTYPCRFIHPSKNNSYLFRVTYYKNRINLEMFHVLADGMGGITVLKELTYHYLRLAHPELMEKMTDKLSDETSLDREDGYKRHFKKTAANAYQTKRAFLIKGEKLPFNGFGVVHGFMSVTQLKEVSHRYGCSINEYLIACFIYSTYNVHYRDISKKRPIRVAVPVNLRPFFESMTTKNFFVMVSCEFAPEKDEYTFEEVLEITKKSLKEQITKENLEKILSYNVGFTQMLFARAVPLPVKNLAMALVYRKSALANTTTITNIGNIKVSPEYEKYIEGFYAFLSFSKGQCLKATICSYKDTLAFTFSSMWMEKDIQKGVFRQIAKDNIDVTIETNGL